MNWAQLVYEPKAHILQILDDLFSSMIKQAYYSLTILGNSCTLEFDNFSKFQNIVSDSVLERRYDAMRTKIDM